MGLWSGYFVERFRWVPLVTERKTVKLKLIEIALNVRKDTQRE